MHYSIWKYLSNRISPTEEVFRNLLQWKNKDLIES